MSPSAQDMAQQLERFRVALEVICSVACRYGDDCKTREDRCASCVAYSALEAEEQRGNEE